MFAPVSVNVPVPTLVMAAVRAGMTSVIFPANSRVQVFSADDVSGGIARRRRALQTGVRAADERAQLDGDPAVAVVQHRRGVSQIEYGVGTAGAEVGIGIAQRGVEARVGDGAHAMVPLKAVMSPVKENVVPVFKVNVPSPVMLYTRLLPLLTVKLFVPMTLSVLLRVPPLMPNCSVAPLVSPLSVMMPVPKPALLPSTTVPSVTITPPLKVLAAFNARLPAPVLARVPLPTMTLLMVNVVALEPTSKVPPLGSSVAPWSVLAVATGVTQGAAAENQIAGAAVRRAERAGDGRVRNDGNAQRAAANHRRAGEIIRGQNGQRAGIGFRQRAEAADSAAAAQSVILRRVEGHGGGRVGADQVDRRIGGAGVVEKGRVEEVKDIRAGAIQPIRGRTGVPDVVYAVAGPLEICRRADVVHINVNLAGRIGQDTIGVDEGEVGQAANEAGVFDQRVGAIEERPVQEIDQNGVFAAHGQRAGHLDLIVRFDQAGRVVAQVKKVDDPAGFGERAGDGQRAGPADAVAGGKVRAGIQRGREAQASAAAESPAAQHRHRALAQAAVDEQCRRC